MFSKFMNLELEKQERILNAAINEFAQKGYDNASTNEIVIKAGISKGLLFHYFQNKKQLYLFLFDYCTNIVIEEYYNQLELEESDFLVKIQQAFFKKMEILHKFPDIYKFLEGAYLEESPQVKATLNKKFKELEDENIGKFYGSVDLSLLRDDIDAEKALQIMVSTLYRMAEEETKKAKLSSSHQFDYDKIEQELTDYINIFRKCFYK